ncbi:hypothetical protein [Emcibacter sp.]|uniref:hypothetical protein n=1 Tax=Emcibacter sp. TaxID=1979954 RepID=UPI003A8EE6A3
MQKMDSIFLTVVTAFLALVMTPTMASATVTTSGCANATSCTLQELVDGGSISVDGVTFNNWSEGVNFFFEENDTTDIEETLNLSGITVEGFGSLPTGTPGEFTLGLVYTSNTALALPKQLSDANEAELELDIDFDLTTDLVTEVTAAQLILDEWSLGSTDAFVELNLTDGGDIDLQTYANTDPEVVSSDAHTLAAAVNAISLESNIQAGMFEPGNIALFEYAMIFTVFVDDPIVVSSPSILLLLGMNLMMLGLRRRLTK